VVRSAGGADCGRSVREKLEGLVVRNAGKRKPEITLELSADKDSFLKDVRPAGAGVSFAQFAL